MRIYCKYDYSYCYRYFFNNIVNNIYSGMQNHSPTIESFISNVFISKVDNDNGTII